MMLRVVCPGCRTSFNVADTLRGKKVRCMECKESFVVREKAGRQGQDQESADEENSALQSRAPGRAAPSRRCRVEEEDAPPRRRRRDDDDDDSDRPSRRGARDERSFPALWHIAVGGVFALAAVVGAGFFVYRLVSKKQAPHTEQVVLNGPFTPAPITQPGQPRPVGNPPAQNHVIPYARRVQLNCKDTEIHKILFSSAEVNQAAVWYVIASTTHRLDRYDLATGKHLSSIELKNVKVISELMCLSPDGGQLAYVDDKDQITVLNPSDGQPLTTDWSPYDAQKKFSAEGMLAWMRFVDSNRLLLLNSASGLDLWDVRQRRAVYSIPPAPIGQRAPTLSGAENNWNVALCDDRRTLAVANGDGFSLIDPSTGQTRSRTASLADRGLVSNTWGTGFSADGNHLAALLTMQTKDRGSIDLLVRWDLKANRVAATVPVPRIPNYGGIMRSLIVWGPHHTLLLSILRAPGHLIDLDSGQFVRTFNLHSLGILADTSPDGRLWYASAQAAGGIAFLTAVDFPSQELPTLQAANTTPVWLSPDGILLSR